MTILRKPWSIVVVHFCSCELFLFPASQFCFPGVTFGFRDLFLVSASYFCLQRVIFHFRDLFLISASY